MKPLQRQRFTIGVDALWMAVGLAIIAVVVSLTTLAPGDFWWHLKVGEWIWIHHAIPRTNIFAWSLPADTPFVYSAWLSELLFYILYLLKGVGAIVFVRNILAVILFGLVGYETKRRSGSWRLGALASLLALVMTIGDMTVTPQIFAWLPFALFMILLGAYADRQLASRWLLVLPAIMIFWVNAHSSFFIGLILVGSFLAGEAIQQRWKPKVERSWRESKWLLAILGLTGLVSLISPSFIRIYEYIFRMLSDKSNQTFGLGWQPTTPSGFSNLSFYITFMGLIFLATQVRRFPKPADMILVCIFTWMAWTSHRNVIWFAFFAVPYFGQQISWLQIKSPFKVGTKKEAYSLAAALLFIPALLFQPGFGDWTGLRVKMVKGISLEQNLELSVSSDTPIRAAEYLKNHPGGSLFNDMVYGSYLDWAVPDQKVFVDPRTDQYPYTMWQDYLRISNGIRSIELLDQYKADRILLNKSKQAELITVLESEPNWKLEYEDDLSQIWMKN